MAAGLRVPWGAWLRGQQCVPQLAGQVRVSVTFSIALGPKPQRGVARGHGAWGAGRGWVPALASKFWARSTFSGGLRPWLPARCSTGGRHAEPPADYLHHLSLALYVSRPRRPQGKSVLGRGKVAASVSPAGQAAGSRGGKRRPGRARVAMATARGCSHGGEGGERRG